MEEKINLTTTLNELKEVVDWFEKKEQIDLEKAIKKVEEASKLIDIARNRLKEIENQFNEIKLD